jgi:osmotically-inducible protein OsmY
LDRQIAVDRSVAGWRPSCRDPSAGRQIFAPKERKAMSMEGVDTAQMVRDALAWDGRLNEANLTVRFGNGVVTLSGVVTSDAQRAEAEDIAQHMPGVNRVVNEILVVRVAGR